MAGEFDFAPMSDDEIAVECDGPTWPEGNGVTEMCRELRASRAALRKVVEASCTDEEIAAMKTARALVAHVEGGE